MVHLNVRTTLLYSRYSYSKCRLMVCTMERCIESKISARCISFIENGDFLNRFFGEEPVCLIFACLHSKQLQILHFCVIPIQLRQRRCAVLDHCPVAALLPCSGLPTWRIEESIRIPEIVVQTEYVPARTIVYTSRSNDK